MYRVVLRLLSASCLLYTFWPVFRINDVTLFDWLAPIVIVLALPYAPKERGVAFSSFALAVAGIALLALGGVISVAPSLDSYEHIRKVFKLVVALSATVGLAYVLENRKILSVNEALTLLCISATVNSAVCILQGQFHLFTGLIPKELAPTGIETWTRMTGLTEWPIEAGQVSDFGVFMALGMVLHTRRWYVFLPLMAINLYSLTESASLTAAFALVIAFAAMGLYAKAYKAIVLGIVIAVCGIALAAAMDARRLTSRLETFFQSQGSYSTVESRELQWTQSIEMIRPSTLFVGNGYSELDLPYKMEIHNGLIAAVFHFGILGLIGQCLLIGYFLVRLRHEAPRPLKSILLGCCIVFAFSYLTGPALSRRALWVTPVILGAYLTTLPQAAAVRARSGAGRAPLRAKRELPGDA